jgi:hypothetical protein
MKYNLIKDNRGATLTNWIFTIATVLLFVFIFQSQVLDEMNKDHNGTVGTGLETGLDTSGLDDLQSLKSSSATEFEGSEVEKTNDGLSLLSTFKIGRLTYDFIIGFTSGNFLDTILSEQLHFPKIVAQVLTLLIWISLIMIFIYIFMKVVP